MLEPFSTYIESTLIEDYKIQPYDLKELYSQEDLKDFYTTLNKNDNIFNSEVQVADNFKLPNSIVNKVNEISSSIGFSDNIVSEVKVFLQKLYLNSNFVSLELSLTDECEFLIYGINKNTYHNILIDNDGDIEVLILPENKENIFSKKFYKEEGIDHVNIINSFNELQ